MYTCSLITILIATSVCNYGTGCSINGTFIPCETNFKLTESGKCEACLAGRYGCNCSLVCPTNTFGEACYSTCNCAADEICDPASGCISNTNISQYTTDTQDTTPMLRNSATSSTSLTLSNVVFIVLVASLVLVVILSISCICFIVRRNLKRGTNSAKKTKNSEEISETAEQNPDSHSYLTISERSFRLYADVHYNEAEERKSLTSLSLHSKGYDTSVSDKSGGSDTSVSDRSGGSNDYLTPTVKTANENTTGSQSSGGYDDIITTCSETCI